MEMSDKLKAHNAVERVCKLLGTVSTEQIYGRDRRYPVAVARQLVYWYLFRVCGMSYSDIGRALGKTHATAMYGVRQIDNILELNRSYDRKVIEAAWTLSHSGRRVEDKIAEIIRDAEPSRGFSVVKMRDYLSFESDFEFGDLGGYVTVRYESHEDEDGELVADGIEDIEVVCCDANNEQVKIDMDYLLDKIYSGAV